MEREDNVEFPHIQPAVAYGIRKTFTFRFNHPDRIRNAERAITQLEPPHCERPVEGASGSILLRRPDHLLNVPSPRTRSREMNDGAVQDDIVNGDGFSWKREDVVPDAELFGVKNGIPPQREGNTVDGKTRDEVAGNVAELDVGDQECIQLAKGDRAQPVAKHLRLRESGNQQEEEEKPSYPVQDQAQDVFENFHESLSVIASPATRDEVPLFGIPLRAGPRSGAISHSLRLLRSPHLGFARNDSSRLSLA